MTPIMEDLEPKKPTLQNLGTIRWKPFNSSPDSVMGRTEVRPGSELPLLSQPVVADVKLVEWAAFHREFFENALLKHGGILFRDFQIGNVDEFENFIKAISGELLPYTNRSSPRSQVSGNIYTSTEFPADQSIPLHNEMSYTRNWPMKIWFYCVKAAEEQGATPIADSRRVFNRIPASIRDRFMAKKVMYIRNYGAGMDLPWEDVFQTTEKAEVEEFCRKADIDFEWREKGRLRTRQVCQAVAKHPKTGEMVWFNQAHLFHPSSLPAAVREVLLSTFRKEDLPRNACYGDGSPIEQSSLDEIRATFEAETILFPWQEGDILMMDNMLVAHGRQPFTGTRKILVGMAEPFITESRI